MICIFSVFFLLNGQVIGQNKYTKSDVRDMFPANIKDLWINTLSGYLDNIHIIDMIIGTDGHTCKGLYTLRNSGVTFFFEGDDIDHQLKLVELTPEARASGFIYGNYDGEHFTALWMNTTKDRTMKMNLSFVNAFEDHQADICKQSQWQRLFTTKFNDKPLKLYISRNDLIFTTTLYEDSHKMTDITAGKGTRVEIIDFKFKNSVLQGKSLVIDTSNLDRMNIVHLDEGGYEVSSAMKLEASIDFDCYEYADYHSRLIATKLKSGNKKFDLWIENKYKKWIDNSIEKLQKVNNNFGTKDRWVQSAEGWVEIDLYTGDMISGTIYLQTSLHSATEKIPFIYDLKSNKELKIQDLFDNKFDSKRYFDAVIPAKKKEISWSSECKKWVDKQYFNFVTLKETGICFRTDFHTVYGEKEIIIPYETVAENLKNKTMVKDIMSHSSFVNRN